MSNRVRCPSCGLNQSLVEADRDQFCHSCGEILREEGAGVRRGEEFGRRRRGRDWEEDEDIPERFRSSGMGTSAIVVLAVGGVLLLLFLGIFLTVIFVQPTVTVGPTVAPPNIPPLGANRPPIRPNPPPIVVNRPPVAPGVNPPAPIAWEVRADPVPQAVKVANADRVVQLGDDNPHFILTPSTPGPFLASGENYQPTSVRAIWNLQTMEKVAEVTGYRMAVFGVLSPDGQYLASKLNAAGVPLVVISCKDSKEAFRPRIPQFPSSDYFDFAGPRRLVVGTKDRPLYKYRVFEVPTGRQLGEVAAPTQPDEKSEAVSGGGRYLAFKSGPRVTILDLDRGQPAGTFDIPGYRPDTAHSHLAFSPDGKELAVLMGVRNLLRVITWDLVGNNLAADYIPPSGLIQTLKTSQKDYGGRHLEWLGDGSGWLIRGEVLLDRARGTPAWTMNLDGIDPNTARRVVGSHLAVVGGTLGGPRSLQLVAIQRGQTNPRVPPPLVPPKSGEPGRYVFANDPTPQPTQIDPLPVVEEKLLDSLELAAPANSIQRLLFTSLEVGQVAVVTTPQTREINKHMSVRLYDLRTGGSVAGMPLFKLPHPPAQMDISPDGNLMVANNPSAPERVVAWSLAEKKQIADWIPYEKSPGTFRRVDVVKVVDKEHVLTRNFPGDVVLWKLPECKPVFTCNCFAMRDLPLSPRRKHVVLRGKQGLELFDIKTGHPTGRFPFPEGRQVHQVLTGSFHPNGKEFAAVLSFGTGMGPSPRELVRWDATTGKVIASQPTLFGEHFPLVWCGEGTLMSGWSLFDLKQGAAVCHYTAAYGHPAHNSPDRRFWFTSAQTPNGPARLAQVPVPEGEARKLAGWLASGDVRLLVKPGTKVSLELDFTGPPDEAEYRSRQQMQLGHALNNLGLVVADGQPIKLRISAKESDTGEKTKAAVTPKGARAGKPDTVEIPGKRLTCELSFTNADGKPLVPVRKHVIEVADLKVTGEAKDDPTEAATGGQTKRLWMEFSRWQYQNLPPGYVARHGGTAIDWPRTVDLGRAKE